MSSDGNVRLDQALGALGYTESLPAHHRSNLLSAIALFAGVNHDEGLAWACEARINYIRAEVESARGGNNGSKRKDMGPKWEIWRGDLFLGFVYTKAEADDARDAGCTVIDKSQ